MYFFERKRQIYHVGSVNLSFAFSLSDLKIRSESEYQYNSPWNIAADFDIDMSFPAGQISEMLMEYDMDHHTGMDINAVADEIYQYTSALTAHPLSPQQSWGERSEQ